MVGDGSDRLNGLDIYWVIIILKKWIFMDVIEYLEFGDLMRFV